MRLPFRRRPAPDAAEVSPSQRLEALAAQVNELAEELRIRAQVLRREEGRHGRGVL